MSVYIVVREWTYDLDKKNTTWYTVFTSLEYKKSEIFLKEFENDCGTDLHICKLPLDTEIEIIRWEKYIVKTKKFKNVK